MSASAANPHKRPRIRDHGVRLGPAQEMDFVNSTMTQFLGGKRKSWMTGQQCDGRRSSQHDANQRSPETTHTLPTTLRPPAKDSIAQSAAEAANSTRAQVLSVSLQPRSVQAVVQNQRAGSTKQYAVPPDPSLPSPSPSDDAQHVADVMYVDHHQVTPLEFGQQSTNPIPSEANPQQSTRRGVLLHAPQNAEKLLSLAEKYGGVDELQRRLEATESSAVRSGHTLMATPRSMSQSRSGGLHALTNTGGTITNSPWPTSSNVMSNGVAQSSSNIHASTYGPSVDLLASGLQFLLPAIHSRIESTRRTQTSGMTGPLEESRLRLLKTACESGDVFYLVLHQLYCLCSTPGFSIGHLDLNEIQANGLAVVEELILPNKGLMNESITWLSVFPQSFESLFRLSSIYRSAYSDVRRCLELLGHSWFQFKGVCITRKCPPIINNMDIDLGVKSTVFQHVIFTALHRLLWNGSHDVCSVKSYDLFKDNQRMSQHWHVRRISGNPPSQDEVALYHQKLVAEYQHSQNCHVQHSHGVPVSANEARQPPSTMMPPLVHNQASSSYQSRPRPPPILPSSRWNASGLATPVQSPVATSPTNNMSVLPNTYHRHIMSYTQQRSAPTPTSTNQTRTFVPPHPSAASQQTQPGLDYYNPSQRSNILPPIGFSLQYNGQPLDNTALHQAHLRNTDLYITRADNEPKGSIYFQYFKELVAEPTLVRPQDRNVFFHFSISAEMLATTTKDEPQPQGAPSIRIAHNKSHIFRLRCVKTAHPNKKSSMPWLTEDTSWPSNAVFVCNDTHLELRRKAHYGKDLPVDITSLVREGDNTIHVAILQVGPSAIDTGPMFAIAVEVIEIGNLSTVKEYVHDVSITMAERIRMRLKPTDSDVEVLNGDITIDVVDPYSSSLIQTPTRGADCRHYECFDLTNFLGTRLGSPKGSPCQPEQFRCPICNGDARPQSLVIDKWFCKVLEGIRHLDRLDARSIIIDAAGTWRIKEEEVEGETGDGTGRRKQASIAPGDSRRASKTIESEVIEID
ncbi:hypothetical protein MMC11_005130 [Xylographa trunciseda]|nr:hypothetical protein [Xylographa trunciseda]